MVLGNWVIELRKSCVRYTGHRRQRMRRRPVAIAACTSRLEDRTLLFAAVGDAFTVDSNSAPTVVDVQANDVQIPGWQFFLYSVSNPANGTATLTAQGEVTYQPDTGFSGTDTFTYAVTDGIEGDFSATVTMTVTPGAPPANSAPVFDQASYSFDVPVDAITGSAVGTLTATDSDGDSLSFSGTDSGSIFTVNSSGVVVVSDAIALGSTGIGQSLAFTAAVSDGTTQNTAAISINVTAGQSPANGAPNAGADTATVESGQSISIDVLANDGDPDGHTLTLVSVSTPANGTVTAQLPLIYEPNDGFVGTDSFIYTVQDELGATATGTVTVTAEEASSPVNTGPEFSQPNFVFQVAEDTVEGTVIGTLTVEDDSGLPLAFGGGDEIFAIDTDTGQILLASATGLAAMQAGDTYELTGFVTNGTEADTAAILLTVVPAVTTETQDDFEGDAEALSTGPDYIAILQASPLSGQFGGLFDVLEGAVDDALAAVDDAEQQADDAQSEADDQVDGGSSDVGESEEDEIENSPLDVLPEGFDFAELTLPILAGGDVFAVQPEGTESFSNMTEIDLERDFDTTLSDSDVSTTALSKTLHSQEYVGPSEFTITQSVTNSYTDTATLPADEQEESSDPNSDSMLTAPTFDEDVSRTVTETYSVSLINGTQSVYQYTLSSDQSFTTGSLAGVTDQDDDQPLEIPQDWIDAVAAADDEEETEGNEDEASGGNETGEGDTTTDDSASGETDDDNSFWDTLFDIDANEPVTDSAETDGTEEEQSTLFGGAAESSFSITVTVIETLVTLYDGQPGRSYTVSFGSSSASTSLAAGQSAWGASEGQLEDVDWDAAVAGDDNEEGDDDDLESDGDDPDLLSEGADPPAGGDAPPADDSESDDESELEGTGNGHQIDADNQFATYGTSSGGMNISLTTTIADGASLDTAETTGSIGVNSGNSGGHLAESGFTIIAQTSTHFGNGYPGELVAGYENEGSSEFNYVLVESDGNVNSSGNFGFDAELPIGNASETTDSSDAPDADDDSGDDSGWTISLFDFSTNSGDGGSGAVKHIEQKGLYFLDGPYGVDDITSKATYTQDGSFSTSASVTLGIDTFTLETGFSQEQNNSYQGEGQHRVYTGTLEDPITSVARKHTTTSTTESSTSGSFKLDLEDGITIEFETESTWDFDAYAMVDDGLFSTGIPGVGVKEGTLSFTVETSGNLADGFDSTTTTHIDDDPHDLIDVVPPTMPEEEPRSLEDILAEYRDRATNIARWEAARDAAAADGDQGMADFYQSMIDDERSTLADVAAAALVAGATQAGLDTIDNEASQAANDDPIELQTIDDFNDVYDDSAAPGYWDFFNPWSSSNTPADGDTIGWIIRRTQQAAIVTAGVAGTIATGGILSEGVLVSMPTFSSWFGYGALTTVSTSAGTAHVSTSAGVASIELGYITRVTPSFVRLVTQTAQSQGATSAIVNTGATNANAAILVGSAMESGSTIFGGTVSLLQGGANPIFQILIPLL